MIPMMKMTRTGLVTTVVTLMVTVMTTSTADAFNNILAPFQQPQRERLKSEILELAKAVDRGLTATDEQKSRMMNLFEKLERLNPTPEPLKARRLIDGSWDLQYTTSDSILGKGGFPRIGPIEQYLDTENRQAYNSEVVNYFGLFPVERKVNAALYPQSARLTNVQFEQFELFGGLVKIKAPSQFKGSLDVTYLDESLRLTRGDKGNIFVLTKM